MRETTEWSRGLSSKLFILHLICFVLSGALVSCANDYAGWNACGTLALFVLVGKYGHSVYWKRRKVNVVD